MSGRAQWAVYVTPCPDDKWAWTIYRDRTAIDGALVDTARDAMIAAHERFGRVIGDRPIQDAPEA